MNYYKEKSVIQNGADPKDADIELFGTILEGKFVDIERPTLYEGIQQISERAGGK